MPGARKIVVAPAGATVLVTLTTTGPGKLAINGIFCVPKPAGAVRVCTRAMPKGGEVRISPVPDGGALFVAWKGLCEQSRPAACAFHPSADLAAGATFALPTSRPILRLEYNTAIAQPTAASNVIAWTIDPKVPVSCTKTIAKAAGKTWYWADVTCTAHPQPGPLTVSGMWQTAAGQPMYPVDLWTKDCDVAGAGLHKLCTLDMRLSRTAGTYGIALDAK